MSAPRTLFYTPGTCALGCMIALEWVGEPYAICLVTRDERGSDRYTRIHPRGQVPALQVDGRVLVEVNAILAHLADRRPDLALLPANGTAERDTANQWLAYFGSGLHPVFWPWYSPQKYTRDPAGVEGVKAAATTAIRRELALVDMHLSTREFVLGTRWSALDAYLYAMARWGRDMLDLDGEFPHVARHSATFGATEAVRRCAALERGRALPTPSTGLVANLTLATFLDQA